MDTKQLQKLINEIDTMLEKKVNPRTSQDFNAWHLRAEGFLKRTFGKNSDEYQRFTNLLFSPRVFGMYDDIDELSIEACAEDLRNCRTHFQVYLEEYTDSGEYKNTSETRNKSAVNYKEYDVFISHANKDKKVYVEELNDVIKRLGINVFFDKESISWGDDWKKVILDGTARSEFAIIVISENFFDREWTEKELNEFLSRQNETGQKIVLPLLLGISGNQVMKKYPSLESIQYISSEDYSKEEIAILLAKELIKRYKL